MNSDNDLLRRGDIVKMLRERVDGYVVSMFATSSECNIARVVTMQCAMDVSCMPAYKGAGADDV